VLKIEIPGFKLLQLEHLVMDYNGTLAYDGFPAQGVREQLNQLAEILQLHVVTADTFGRVRSQLTGWPCRLELLGHTGQDVAKKEYVENLGASGVVAIGNGRNDRLMMRSAALGICVLGNEGAAAETLAAADVVCRSIGETLQLLLNPMRLVATLRS